jgi:hypothetical protein
MARTEDAPDATLSLSNPVSSLTPTVFEQTDRYYEDITSVARTWTSVYYFIECMMHRPLPIPVLICLPWPLLFLDKIATTTSA